MSIIVILIVAFICLAGMKRRGDDNYGLVPRSFSNSIKGIGILVVFFNHIYGYLGGAVLNEPDSLFFFIVNLVTQLFVASFLFFSGYGVTESIQIKGSDYVRNIPKRRLLTTLLNFDIAVVVYIVVVIIIGEPQLTTKQVFLSLIGWESVGNSNWYIFCILCCYLFSYLSARLSENPRIQVICLVFLSLIYIFVMSVLKESWWYSTIMAYPFGAICSYLKKEIEKLCRSNFFIVSISAVVVFVVLFYTSTNNAYLFNLTAISFCIILLLVGLKLEFKSKIMGWLGDHLFQIYIYQRLPMIVLCALAPTLAILHTWVYIGISFITTIIIALIVPKISLK